jgi:hypothetical protein
LKVHINYFSKIKKVQKKSQNSRNQGFSYYFCLLIEVSGSGSTPLTMDPDRGSKTCGSGSGFGSGSSTQVFPVIFILRLLRNLPASAWQKVYLLRPKDISGKEGSMGEGQNVPAPTGSFIHSQNCNFPE